MERIRVSLERPRNDSYEILIGEGASEHLSRVTEISSGADQCFIITDSNVRPYYGDLLKHRLKAMAVPVHLIEIAAGEQSKSINTVLEVSRQLVRLNATRKSLIIALGGGVVGDVAGFIASIYMRSVPYVQVPTTLLAQVDSSVGGKTGVDIPEGKNLLGAFYQPRAVYIDLAFLKTLSDRDFANGMAEVIKYAVIDDVDLFEILEKEADAVKDRRLSVMQTLIGRSCRIKAGIVEKDEKEGGLRRILNFGHTLGHAMEAASGYSLSHGEAVAIGMAGAARISERLDHLDTGSVTRVIDLIEGYDLPTTIPGSLNASNVISFLSADKKVAGGKLHFVLLRKIGDPFVTPEVPAGVIEETIKELQV